MPTTHKPADTPPKDSRATERDSMLLMATCRMPRQANEQKIKVRNLSKNGLMAEATVQPQVGDWVTITLRNIGEVDGTVAWVRDNRFGVALARNIDPQLTRNPITETEPRDYYQQGPVSVIARQDERDPKKLRPI